MSSGMKYDLYIFLEIQKVGIFFIMIDQYELAKFSLYDYVSFYIDARLRY